MVQLRNVNPLGHVDLPLIGREGHPEDAPDEGEGCLKPGEVFDVTQAQAEHLLEQVGNYELADAAAEKARQADLAAAAAQAAADAEPAAETPARKPGRKRTAKKAADKGGEPA